jgi:hypothetical protein
MTIINRALLKAYERRADADAASELEQHPSAVIRGWARTLREPIRAANGEGEPEEGQPTADEVMQSPAQGSAVGAVVVEQLQIAVEQKTVAEAEADIPVVSLYQPDGTMMRFDPAHVPAVEIPPEPLETEPVSAAASIAPSPVAPAPAQPVWIWPTIVERLLACPAAADLRELADRLHVLAADCDLRCVAFGGPGRRAGRTSLIVTLAWVLAEEKSSRVAIVDAHFDNPGLAQALSLRSGAEPAVEPGAGFGAALGDNSLDSVESTTTLSDNLVIASLFDRVPVETIGRGGIGQLQSLLRSLRRDFDLVLVDAGAWQQAGPPLVLECRAIDAFVCVARSSSPSESPVGEQNLEQLGIEWLGQVEIFVPAVPA